MQSDYDHLAAPNLTDAVSQDETPLAQANDLDDNVAVDGETVVTVDEEIAAEVVFPASMPADDETPTKSDFVPDPDDIRLHALNLAIELHPEAGVNYLLRGEWFLAKKQAIIARADFQTAVQLAEAQLETSQWGFSEQWVRDRALAYLADT